MSGKIPALPPVAAPPIKVTPPSSLETAAAAPRPAEHHSPAEHRPAAALSPADISYVDGLMGIAPPQAMEYILLKTGVPMPANLGQDVDTSV